jgi:hypothetical protein
MEQVSIPDEQEALAGSSNDPVDPLPKGGPFQRLADFVFGYDFFISYWTGLRSRRFQDINMTTTRRPTTPGGSGDCSPTRSP